MFCNNFQGIDIRSGVKFGCFYKQRFVSNKLLLNTINDSCDIGSNEPTESGTYNIAGLSITRGGYVKLHSPDDLE